VREVIMTIDVEDRSGVTIVRLRGEFGSEYPGRFVRTVTELLQGPQTRIVVDLSEVSYMSSTGLGELVRVTAQANTQEGRVVLAEPSPFVRGVLETTQLHRFFELHPTVDQALAALG
jgi:anti-anti-sigma factor